MGGALFAHSVPGPARSGERGECCQPRACDLRRRALHSAQSAAQRRRLPQQPGSHASQSPHHKRHPSPPPFPAESQHLSFIASLARPQCLSASTRPLRGRVHHRTALGTRSVHPHANLPPGARTRHLSRQHYRSTRSVHPPLSPLTPAPRMRPERAHASTVIHRTSTLNPPPHRILLHTLYARPDLDSPLRPPARAGACPPAVPQHVSSCEGFELGAPSRPPRPQIRPPLTPPLFGISVPRLFVWPPRRAPRGARARTWSCLRPV